MFVNKDKTYLRNLLWMFVFNIMLYNYKNILRFNRTVPYNNTFSHRTLYF